MCNPILGKQISALLQVCPDQDLLCCTSSCDGPQWTSLANALAKPPSSTTYFTSSRPESQNWDAKPCVPHPRTSTRMASGNHQGLQSFSSVSPSRVCSHPCRSCHCATGKATCGTDRCWEVFAAQQQLGVRRSQYILQWRETEPSSGPVPSWHRDIWNMGQEQSVLLITVCLVQWKTCNIWFTSWIPNCLAIFPSTFQIYCSVRAWPSL